MAFLRASGSAITPIPAVTQHSDLITFRGKQYRFAPSNLEALITPAALNPSVNRTLYFDDVGHASADGSPVKPYRLDTILSGGTGGPTITNGDKIMIKGNHTYSAYAGNTGPLTINGKSDITIGWWGDSPPRLTTERTISYGSAFRMLDSTNVTILPGIIETF